MYFCCIIRGEGVGLRTLTLHDGLHRSEAAFRCFPLFAVTPPVIPTAQRGWGDPSSLAFGKAEPQRPDRPRYMVVPTLPGHSGKRLHLKVLLLLSVGQTCKGRGVLSRVTTASVLISFDNVSDAPSHPPRG